VSPAKTLENQPAHATKESRTLQYQVFSVVAHCFTDGPQPSLQDAVIALKREKGNAMRYPEAQSDGKSHVHQPQNVPIQSIQADESPSIVADGFNAD